MSKAMKQLGIIFLVTAVVLGTTMVSQNVAARKSDSSSSSGSSGSSSGTSGGEGSNSGSGSGGSGTPSSPSGGGGNSPPSGTTGTTPGGTTGTTPGGTTGTTPGGTTGTTPPSGTIPQVVTPPPQTIIKGPIQQQNCAASGIVALVQCEQIMNIKNIHNTVVRGSNYAVGAPGATSSGASPTVLFIQGVGYVELTGVQNAGNGQATITYFVLVPTK